MNTYDSFIEEICASPEDDTPRLILADWLDEYGVDAERRYNGGSPSKPYGTMLDYMVSDWEKALSDACLRYAKTGRPQQERRPAKGEPATR